MIGLSQITSKPRSRAATLKRWWVSLGVMMATASAPSSRAASAVNSSSPSPYDLSSASPIARPAARDRSGSEEIAPATSSNRSSSVAAVRCMAPMKLPGPPPITASRSRRPIISITGFLSMSPNSLQEGGSSSRMSQRSPATWLNTKTVSNGSEVRFCSTPRPS